MLYPISTQTRTVQDLNGIWKFMLEDDMAPNDVSTPLETNRHMSVPGSFNDQGVTRDIRMHIGYVWYEKEFIVPNMLLDQRIVLRLDAATHEADVYVNGEFVVRHKGGYVPFEAEIQDVIKPGRNRVTVKLSNRIDYTSLPVGNYKETKTEDGKIVRKLSENFDFFNYAGLNRYVRIYTTPKSYIDDIAITYDVDLDALTADVKVATTASGDFDQVKVKILDACDRVVGKGVGETAVVSLEDLKLWQPLNAYLYKAQVNLCKEGEIVDVYEEEFGIRTVEVKGTQFLINGRPFYFKGYGKHEDTYINGRGINEAYNIADINLMRWMGANSFRTSHYPYSEEMMRLCDREGIVVIDECAAVGMFEGFSVDSASGMAAKSTWSVLDTKEAHEQAMYELIKRDKNHACVVMWSVMNEPDSAGPGAREYFEHIFDYSRKLDPQNRPFTYVNFQICGVDKDICTDLVDVICLNRYFGWYWDTADFVSAEKHLIEDLEKWHAKYPDKPIMFCEYGADTVAGLHAVDDIPFTEDYQVKYYEINSRVFDQFDFFVGEQLWNFADFETKTGINRVQGNKKGIFTRGREPKAAARLLRDRWLKIPDFDYKK
ncbi:MAG: beta-glucuronidase [Clostridiaceae bacterium]|jgi:beta-glucuronidase|nr:beta-glucuronidase [Clostridiaceae bacterium]